MASSVGDELDQRIRSRMRDGYLTLAEYEQIVADMSWQDDTNTTEANQRAAQLRVANRKLDLLAALLVRLDAGSPDTPGDSWRADSRSIRDFWRALDRWATSGFSDPAAQHQARSLALGTTD